MHRLRDPICHFQTHAANVSDGWNEPMSCQDSPTFKPDENALPSKRRFQSVGVSESLCDAATFKVPYPYGTNSGLDSSHICSPQSISKHTPGLYQPWTQNNTSPSPKAHIVSTFREQQGWAERRELTSLHPAWGLAHNHSHSSGKLQDFFPPGLHPDYPLQAVKLRPAMVTEKIHSIGVEHTREASTLRGQLNLDGERQTSERIKGLFLKRRERHMKHYDRVIWPSPTPCSQYPSPSPLRGHALPGELTYKHQTSRATKQPLTGKSPSIFSSLRALPSDEPNSRWTYMAVKDISLGSPIHSSSSSSSPSNPIPWLLPHFAAGSLIKLRDGRLRRIEDLETDDFLLGSLACPDLRLCYYTVQSISPSASSLSRLLVLLHGQLSQEIVDVYVEYPFFVRGQGWSSCCPQETARLCGLQCRQLSVGDVCLALTPVPTKGSPYFQPPSSPLLESLQVTNEK